MPSMQTCRIGPSASIFVPEEWILSRVDPPTPRRRRQPGGWRRPRHLLSWPGERLGGEVAPADLPFVAPLEQTLAPQIPQRVLPGPVEQGNVASTAAGLDVTLEPAGGQHGPLTHPLS